MPGKFWENDHSAIVVVHGWSSGGIGLRFFYNVWRI